MITIRRRLESSLVREFQQRLQLTRTRLLRTAVTTDAELATLEGREPGAPIEDAVRERMLGILSRLEDHERHELEEIDAAVARLGAGPSACAKAAAGASPSQASESCPRPGFASPVRLGASRRPSMPHGAESWPCGASDRSGSPGWRRTGSPTRWPERTEGQPSTAQPKEIFTARGLWQPPGKRRGAIRAARAHPLPGERSLSSRSLSIRFGLRGLRERLHHADGHLLCRRIGCHVGARHRDRVSARVPLDFFGRSSTIRGPTIFQSPFLTGWLLPTDVTRQAGLRSYGSSVETVRSTGTILTCGADTITGGVAVTLVITRLTLEFPELVTAPP